MSIRKYPLSAANGRAIPAEVFSAITHISQAITTSVLGTLIQDANYTEHLMLLYCDQDALITFSADDVISGDTESFWINKDQWHILEPMQEYYDVKATTTSGTVRINTVLRYDTLGIELQTGFR